MSIILTVLKMSVMVLLRAYMVLLFLRVIISWLPIDEDGAFAVFVVTVTELVVAPVRGLVERSDSLADLPIDLALFITYLLLSVIYVILSVI